MVRRVEDTLAISIGTDLTEDRGQGLLIPFPSMRRFFKLVRLSFTSHHLHRCVKLESKDWSCAENLRYDKEDKQPWTWFQMKYPQEPKPKTKTWPCLYFGLWLLRIFHLEPCQYIEVRNQVKYGGHLDFFSSRCFRRLLNT